MRHRLSEANGIHWERDHDEPSTWPHPRHGRFRTARQLRAPRTPPPPLAGRGLEHAAGHRTVRLPLPERRSAADRSSHRGIPRRQPGVRHSRGRHERRGRLLRDPALARQTNTTATRLLAELAERQAARMVFISTDLVFRGDQESYVETDCPAPLSVYGQTKASAERSVLEHARHLVLRMSLLFGPSLNGRPSSSTNRSRPCRTGRPARCSATSGVRRSLCKPRPKDCWMSWAPT